MVLPTLTQIRARTNGGEAHFAHVTLHRFPIDTQVFAQFLRDLARAIERTRGIDFINAAFDPELFGRRRHRLIVQPTAIQTEQFGLNA